MIVKLHKGEFDLLKSVITPEFFGDLNYTVDGYHRIFLDISDEAKDELSDILQDRLIQMGFKADWTPNALGNSLESLIDKFVSDQDQM
jgi:hypothetical protein